MRSDRHACNAFELTTPGRSTVTCRLLRSTDREVMLGLYCGGNNRHFSFHKRLTVLKKYNNIVEKHCFFSLGRLLFVYCSFWVEVNVGILKDNLMLREDREHVMLTNDELETVIMVALWNRADHYIFILSFVLSSFFHLFPHLISAVADWMSAILPQMVWP